MKKQMKFEGVLKVNPKFNESKPRARLKMYQTYYVKIYRLEANFLKWDLYSKVLLLLFCKKSVLKKKINEFGIIAL